MLTIIGFAALAVTAVAHAGTLAIAAVRLLRRPKRPDFGDKPPAVSILRPMKGLENHLEECVATSFRLTYPRYEVIFCIEDEDDDAVPMVRRLMAAHPSVDARLIFGRERVGANPKLNNLVKGWHAAKHDWIVMSDSNALLPPDYVEGLLVRWGADTGVVSTAAAVTRPEGFAAALECAFMNALQARWVLAADSVGMGYALGKTLMYRRAALDALGGLPRLAEQAAEDIASTHVMREAGLGIRLAQQPVRQPIGRRRLAEVWQRQVRWARLRRSGLKPIYAAELLSGGALPMAIAAALTVAGAVPVAAALGFAVLWYGAETAVTAAVGWPVSWRTPFALVLRDLLLPAVWVGGWIGNRFEWRGQVMTVSPSGRRAIGAEATDG
ncbi:MAG: glycosyltransferase [Bauldia sp.]|nr:glycosyltransferase [Bauldia sp.]